MPDRKQVYLGGAMSHRTFDQMTGWRLDATVELAHVGINSINPCRDLEGLDLNQKKVEGKAFPKVLDPSFYVARDLQDIRDSDALLIGDCDYASTPSLGTCVEIGFAVALGKPIFAIEDAHYTKSSDMIRELCVDIYSDVADAIAGIQNYFEDKALNDNHRK